MKYIKFIKEKMIKESPDWDDIERENHPKRKKNDPVVEPAKPELAEKPVCPFKVGDTLVLADNKKSSKIPEDAWDFLMTYKEYDVLRVNDNGKLDLGCHISKNTPEGGVEKLYLFSPKRFALKK